MTLQQIMAANAQAGRHFFERDTLRFFKSRVSDRTYPAADGRTFFVTSERHRNDPRRYTVRVTRDGADIDTVGGFQAYRDARTAHAAAAYFAKGGE